MLQTPSSVWGMVLENLSRSNFMVSREERKGEEGRGEYCGEGRGERMGEVSTVVRAEGGERGRGEEGRTVVREEGREGEEGRGEHCGEGRGRRKEEGALLQEPEHRLHHHQLRPPLGACESSHMTIT